MPKRFFRFETQDDSKVCDICLGFEGQEWSDDEDIPDEAVPPCHINCRCQLIHDTEPETEANRSILQRTREKRQRMESLIVFDSLDWNGKPRRRRPLKRGS